MKLVPMTLVSCDGWTCMIQVAPGTEEFMKETFSKYTAREITNYNELMEIQKTDEEE